MSTAAPPRPRQVTLAGWLIMIGSGVVVFSAFERVSGLRSLESQEAVADFLSEPPGSGLGLTVSEMLDVIRVLSLVAAGCATAAAILGFWVLKGSKGSRLGLTFLALPLLLTGLATGGLVSSLVAAAAVMLWVQPARSWFQGRPPPAAPAAPAAPTEPTEPPAPTASTTAPPGQSTPAPALDQWGVGPAPPRPRRPPAVVWACTLTWACCGLIAAGLGATVLALLVAPDMLFDELHRQNPDLADQGLSDGEIKAASYLTAGLALPWCLAASGFAVQAIRRIEWGRRALLISAGIAGGVSLLGMFASAIMVLPFVATVVTVALLSRPEVRAWFRDRSRRGSVSS